MILWNKTKNCKISDSVLVANTLFKKLKGLLGKTSLPKGEVMWIPKCNSIHTFFMRFSIDAVFVDKKMVIQKIEKNIEPGRIIIPVFRARDVFEMPVGTSDLLDVGDELNVRD